MRANEMDEALIDSTSEVLETMYFTEVTGRSGSTDVSGECFTARIDYSGHAAGAFGICIPLGTARDLAANFLGTDESTVSIEQAREVTGELGNMICGAVLNRLVPNGRFELSHPEVTCGRWNSKAPASFLQLDNGMLAAWFYSEQLE
jgi:CheY-specific phosphatase CheX